MHEPFHEYLPARLCTWIEQHYYAQVNARARFELLIDDPAFWDAPRAHVGLFSDHGVVHVRDVARQIASLIDDIHGLLIPKRSPERLDPFMKGYGVTLAYLHDIGMIDFSAIGRAMHPEYAAQAVFSPAFEEWVESIIAENIGGMIARLRSMAESGALTQPPEIVLREMLSLSLGHSKSKVPITILNDRTRLRAAAQESIATDLPMLYARQQQAKGHTISAPAPTAFQRELLSRSYADFERDSFSWLVAADPESERLADDVIDTLRALRAADALRKRGTVQKSSGGYEVFISQQTGAAVYAFRLGSDQMYLLEIHDRMSAGEANIASTELDRAGNLRISFHRGAFASETARMHAVAGAAVAVQDIQADVIASFDRSNQPTDSLTTNVTIQTCLESTDDSHSFVDLVSVALRELNPAATAPILIVPSLHNVPEAERARYLAVPDLTWSEQERRNLLERMARSGAKVDSIDPEQAFRHVRCTILAAGETLLEAGQPAGMVYLPLGEGLRIVPLGGYDSFSVQAWMPLGSTGVIRGALRNANVIAEQTVSALMIPKDVYLRHWHTTYTIAELRQRLKGVQAI